MKKFKYIYLILLCFLTSSLEAQTDLANDGLMGSDGRNTTFLFGNMENQEQSTVKVLTDNSYKRMLEITLQHSKVYIELDLGFTLNEQTLELITEKFLLLQEQKLNAVNVSENLANQKNACKTNVVSIGRTTLPKNIRTLHFEMADGTPINLESSKNIRKIFIDNYILTNNLNYSDDYNLSHMLSNNNYPGDPFFCEKLIDLKKLEHIHIQPSYAENTDLMTKLFVSPEKLTEIDGIKGIHLEDISFFSVNFFNFSETEYLFLKNSPGPELVNLSLFFFLHGKDMSAGNWKHFLKHADTTKVPTISKDCRFKTLYANGQLLCTGGFSKGLPDGNWTFYYDNGDLCEKRTYQVGEKTGDWTFMRPKNDNHQNLDTLLFHKYSDDKLIFLKEWDERSYSYCTSPDITVNSEILQEYYISYLSPTSVSIERNEVKLSLEIGPGVSKGDTLETVKELWVFDSNSWSHIETYMCHSNGYKHEVETMGEQGKTAYYMYEEKTNFKLKRNTNNKLTNKTVDTWLIDLRKMVWEKNKFDNDNVNANMNLIQKDSGKVSADYWQSTEIKN